MTELYHHGIKGMKWGVRRYQNKDGGLTPAGRKRYADDGASDKDARQKQIKGSVKRYKQQFDEASKASDVADASWRKVQEQYKALGKTRVSRMLAAARNKTEAAKRYNKSYDDWNKLAELADSKWNSAKKSYVDTGRNRVSRIINNIKYG